MPSTDLNVITDKFDEYTRNPVKFLTVQNEVRDDLKDLIKSLYDYTKIQEKGENNTKSGALPELIVKDFDEEQIWQQLELENNMCWDQIVSEVAKCVSIKDRLQFPIEVLGEDAGEGDDEDIEGLDEDIYEEDEHESENEDIHVKSKKTKPKPSKHFKKSIVDDEFFNLNQMEHFLLKEEKVGESKKPASDSEEESIDMFEEEDEEDLEEQGEENNVMYSDFFDGDDVAEHNNDIDEQNQYEDIEPKQTRKEKKSVRFADIEEEPSEESDTEVDNDKVITETKSLQKQSVFELRQSRLKQQISKLENNTLSEAPWQMKGEVDASKRPQNSLLEEIIDFDLTTRPAPIITEETTFTLEDLIKRRIKDKAWDDVVKKAKPVEDALEFRKPEILDHSKSKLSLAQVYEAEYLKQKHGTEEEKEPEAHTQIREDMKKLFAKLDALSHYHYTPKACKPDVKIVSNTPAISMEEVAPVATSNSALLAPEEVKKKKKGEMMSKEERSTTDKKRERRKKKQFQKEKGKFEKKDNGKVNGKNSESKDRDKSLKTSKSFFEHLNSDVNSLIKPGKFVKARN